ncbi:hypothetical protein K7711_43305 [Nocardia sp. CA2R105]|uniref:hypothetical protein n=1 Tax=Nocardia coffeae TaxID=2873381 RepID=UPI001CA69DBD|nr:hypothetical protein [Nocardia coffeae]MBY8863358.1 hypothetical protein [Nocardia coffeae]
MITGRHWTVTRIRVIDRLLFGESDQYCRDLPDIGRVAAHPQHTKLTPSSKGLLQDEVTVSVTRPDWPVGS